MRTNQPALGHVLRALARPPSPLTSDSFAFGAEDQPAAVNGVYFLLRGSDIGALSAKGTRYVAGME